MSERNQILVRLCCAAVVLVALPGLGRAQYDNQPHGQAVRLGVVAFDEHGADHDRLHRILRELSAKSSSPLRFQVARGTYGDVVHWMNQGSIDLAIVTPGLFPFGESAAPDDAGRDRVRYLATVAVEPAITPLATAERKANHLHDRVRSLAIVRRDSTLRTAADLDRAARGGRLRLLLVHPLSVSGAIAPRYALGERGIDLSTAPIVYTHSHSASVRLLLENTHDRLNTDDQLDTVAFVWDDALRSNLELADSVRSIPFPELDRLVIPTDAFVARADFARADEVQRLLLDHRDPDNQAPFTKTGDLSDLYGEVARWQRAAGGAADQRNAISFDEIGRLLVHHASTQPRPPRLALVLSGGGAKCSYQVGAVAAIEEQLAILRAANPQFDFDIHLVVGTSGGAINALPVALGITRSAAGRQHFQTVWKSLDQRDIVRPSWLARANMGLWFVLLQAAIVLFVVRRLVHGEARRIGWCAAVFAALGAVQLLLTYVDFKPWRILGANHLVHHVWLWMSFGSPATAWGLLVLGVAIVCWALAHGQKPLPRISGRFVKPVLWLGLLGLPLLHMVTVLFFQHTLSGGEGMEQALATNYPVLIDGELSRRGLPALDLSAAASDAERLRLAGKQLVERGLHARDLVITGSRLPSANGAVNALPSDVYFYLPRKSANAAANPDAATPPFGPRGVRLRERPDILLDVVLGSGSIFPVFPARRLPAFPTQGAEMELVDGGFAHNSPIEAAVLWGATHIILVEASPQARQERTNFATNAIASFNHLYEQSQLLDARARGKVAIYTLAPRPPHLCVLDFADNLIEDSIARGYADAQGRSTGPVDHAPTAAGGFHKELGEPVFVDLLTRSE